VPTASSGHVRASEKPNVSTAPTNAVVAPVHSSHRGPLDTRTRASTRVPNVQLIENGRNSTPAWAAVKLPLLLHEDRQHELHAVAAELEGEAVGDRRRERVPAEDRQRQHGMAAAPFDHKKRHQGHHRERAEPEGDRRGPAAEPPSISAATIVLSATMPEICPGRSGDCAGPGLRLPGVPDGQEGRDHPDRHVDQEDRAPAERLGQQAAGDRPGDQRHAAGGAPQGDRLGPLDQIGIGPGDDRERRGQQTAGGDALHRAGRDQEPERATHRAQQRRQREQGQRPDEQPPRSPSVADVAAVSSTLASGIV